MTAKPQTHLRQFAAGLTALPRRLWAAGRGRARARYRRREEIELTRNSPLFDAGWYLASYPDVAAAGIDPVAHFVDIGWREGRDPGPDFATSGYLKANADVAWAGINPLIHYIEFGRSEGREVRLPRARAAPDPIVGHRFAEAAPVFKGESSDEPATPWRRWHRLDRSDRRLISIGDWSIGYVDAKEARSRVEAAFNRLRGVSGFATHSEELPKVDANDAVPEFIDGWYVNDGQLRLRWGGSSAPFVVRAYQHDPLNDGKLSMVAEGLIVSPLDFVDASLNNPFFPILFIFADPNGVVCDTQLMAFPSLCRGGVHYPELLALSVSRGASRPDPVGVGLAEYARLASVRTSPERLVRAILVDLTGADGTSPLLQRDFQTWLARVAGVRVWPIAAEEGVTELLAGMSGHLPLEPPPDQSLRLACDLIPTIHALGALQAEAESAGFLSLLIAARDASQPVTLLEMPPAAPEAVKAAPTGHPTVWPRLSGGGGPAGVRALRSLGPAAIRLAPECRLSDSELLFPVATAQVAAAPRPNASITWLIAPGEWDLTELLASIRALSLQSGASAHTIGFIGEPEASARRAAAKLFHGRVCTYADPGAASRQMKSEFTGYVGPGVILHNSRSTEFLLSMLADQSVASAACALVTAERRGKAWHVAVADAGVIAASESKTSGMTKGEQAQQWWRGSYPIAHPPRDLWLTRTSLIESWLGTENISMIDEGVHVCTTLVTAAYFRDRSKSSAAIALPRVATDRALRTSVLFG